MAIPIHVRQFVKNVFPRRVAPKTTSRNPFRDQYEDDLRAKAAQREQQAASRPQHNRGGF